MTRTISAACSALDLALAIKRPLLAYIDELSFHLEEAVFEASTDLDQATAQLEAILNDDGEMPGDVAPVDRSWRTAVGYLLEAAIDQCSTPMEERWSVALRSCIRHLDVDLQEVRWIPPVSMRDTQERLARAVGTELPSILADYEPISGPSYRRGRHFR